MPPLTVPRGLSWGMPIPSEHSAAAPAPTLPRAAPPSVLILQVLAAVAAVALAARVDVPVPGTPVPQSLQTLAVVVAGGLLGAGRGAGALALYALAGAAGLPVFADGASGVDRLTGPTGGFLAGFVAGAAVAGAWMRRAGSRSGSAFLLEAFLGMLLAHAVILAAGWARLALLVGADTAWAQGVAPFVVGGVVKSAVAAGLLWAAASATRREGPAVAAAR